MAGDRKIGRLLLIGVTLVFGCVATVVVWRKLIRDSRPGAAEKPASAAEGR